MKLDEITDIEILRNELKEHMAKCKNDYVENNVILLNKGEYYDVDQDQDYVYIYTDNCDKMITFSYKDAKIYLEE